MSYVPPPRTPTPWELDSIIRALKEVGPGYGPVAAVYMLYFLDPTDRAVRPAGTYREQRPCGS